MQGLIWSRPNPSSQPSAMMRGSVDATARSDGRRFDGTLIVREPAIRSARNDDDPSLFGATSRAGAAAVAASGPTSDPDRATIATAVATSAPPAPRPSAGR